LTAWGSELSLPETSSETLGTPTSCGALRLARAEQQEIGNEHGELTNNAELREAVLEFRQYLSDKIAPLMVADSMALLIRYPATAVASEIQTWAAQQQAHSTSVPLVDFLFHGIKKVALTGDFELVPKDVLKQYLHGLAQAVEQYCPEADREVLKRNIGLLGQSDSGDVDAEPVDVTHLKGNTATPAKPAPAAGDQTLSQEAALGLRRLSVFLEHLQPQAPAAQREEVASQFMTAAAAQSTSEQELEQHLAPLRELGIDTGTEKVFKTIAQSLPGWGNLPQQGAAGAAGGVQLNAMRQIVALAEDPAESAKRFRELVHAAIEQFNQGHLGRAVLMFELAEQLVADKKVQPMFVDNLRKQGHEYLDAAKLKKLIERADLRAELRKVFDFFLSLRAEGLLAALDGEPQRERRHELLALLEVHEGAARAKAYELLKASVEPGASVDPFFQLNLVYLLRTIPRPADVRVEDEVNLVMRVSGKSSPAPLIKHVLSYLAQTHHDKAERALITYLRVFENMLLQPETAVYPPDEIETLLDRSCAALARYATPRSWRALVDHGLKAETRLGATLSRLVEAGRQDLSGSKDLVGRIVAALRAELPRSVLGFKVKRNDERIGWLIQALAGTPLPDVRAALQELVDKHPGEKFAEAAAKALAGLKDAGKSPEPAPGISGDLDLFGLPALLQTLGQTTLTGVLGLMDGAGQPKATLVFDAGRVRGAHYGSLHGDVAVYQLFERPFPGTFAFVSRQDIASHGPLAEPQDIVGLILEGVRRHDEWKQAAAVVPDAVKLQSTGKARTPLADEDGKFAETVWSKAAKGATPLQCEAGLAADSYRVRRLLAHWVEEGALKAA
jgi:hypothetical protein